MKKTLTTIILATFVLLNGCAEPNTDEMAGKVCDLEIEDIDWITFTDETKIGSTVAVDGFFDHEMTYVNSTNRGTYIQDNYAYKSAKCSYVGSVLNTFSRIGMEFPENYVPRTETVSFEEAEEIVGEELKDLLAGKNFILHKDESGTRNATHSFVFFSQTDGIIVDVLNVMTDLCGNILSFGYHATPSNILDTLYIPDDFDRILIEKAKEYIASRPDDMSSLDGKITNERIINKQAIYVFSHNRYAIGFTMLFDTIDENGTVQNHYRLRRFYFPAFRLQQSRTSEFGVRAEKNARLLHCTALGWTFIIDAVNRKQLCKVGGRVK